MDPIALVALFVASTINAAIPGPCILLTIGRSARGGLRSGLRVSAGVLFGNLVLVSVATLALLGLLTISLQALTAMKWAGGATMLWLAVCILRPRRSPPADHPTRRLTDVGDLVSGAMVGLSSPFTLVFMLALLPQFIPATGFSIADAVSLGAAFLAGPVVAQTGATLLGAGSLRAVGGISRWIEILCSAVLIGFAGMVLLTPLD